MGFFHLNFLQKKLEKLICLYHDNMQADEISELELEIITQKIGEEVVLKNVISLAIAELA